MCNIFIHYTGVTLCNIGYQTMRMLIYKNCLDQFILHLVMIETTMKA